MALTTSQLRHHQVRDALVYWVYIPLAVIGGGLMLDRLEALPGMSASGVLTGLAVALLAAGLLFIQWSSSDLMRIGGGTPNPKAPARRLVTGGSYAICRHPMFLGYDLASLGVVLLCRSWGMVLETWPVMLLLQLRFLRGEERILSRRFGEEWEAYCRRVPFLFPRLFHGRAAR